MQNNNDELVKSGKLIDPETPQEEGESAVSGTEPDPESDDNALDVAKEVGLYPEANSENPSELNIAEQVEKAEEAHRED